MHAGYGANGTTAALPNMINQLRAMGYSFVTLSQLMNTTSTPGTGSGTNYTVQAGDTLYAIALRYGVTVQAIVNANGFTNANLIRVGQVLTIPGTGTPTTPTPPTTPTTGTSYTVKAGDTLVCHRLAVWCDDPSDRYCQWHHQRQPDPRRTSIDDSRNRHADNTYDSYNADNRNFLYSQSRGYPCMPSLCGMV